MVYESSNNEADQPTSARDPGGDSSALQDTLGDSRTAPKSGADLGRNARAGAERVRASAARGLDTAADAVHSGGDRVASAAHRTGDALASGANYLRVNDTGEMIDDFMGLLRNNPGPALLGAAALGFLLGRAVYRH